MSAAPLDILALAAHRDDVEQTCGGTLLKMAQRGYRTGILDLTRGEMGTRGSAEDRAREAAEAAKILCAAWRDALDIPDGRVENTWENRLKVARVIREQRPRVVILPYWKGRHPDHYKASVLGYEACFLAGLAKLDVIHALIAYKSQFSDQEAGKGIFPAEAEIRSRIEAMARFYGLLGGVTYAEPFLQKEVGLVEDLTMLPVKSI